MKKDIIVW